MAGGENQNHMQMNKICKAQGHPSIPPEQAECASVPSSSMGGSAVSHQASMVSGAFCVGLSVGLSAESVDRRAAVGVRAWVGSRRRGREVSERKKTRARQPNATVETEDGAHAWASLQVSHLQEHG
jgi:hypothetical protein